MGRPPKNQDQVNSNVDDLMNEIEALKTENAELKNQAEFQKSVTDGIIKDWTEKFNDQSEMLQNTKDECSLLEDTLQSIINENSACKNPPRPTVAGIKITADHSVFYKGVSYAKNTKNSIIENPPESDIDELLKFGELV